MARLKNPKHARRDYVSVLWETKELKHELRKVGRCTKQCISQDLGYVATLMANKNLEKENRQLRRQKRQYKKIAVDVPSLTQQVADLEQQVRHLEDCRVHLVKENIAIERERAPTLK
jgi:hypothetical protein